MSNITFDNTVNTFQSL